MGLMRKKDCGFGGSVGVVALSLALIVGFASQAMAGAIVDSSTGGTNLSGLTNYSAGANTLSFSGADTIVLDAAGDSFTSIDINGQAGIIQVPGVTANVLAISGNIANSDASNTGSLSIVLNSDSAAANTGRVNFTGASTIIDTVITTGGNAANEVHYIDIGDGTNAITFGSTATGDGSSIDLMTVAGGSTTLDLDMATINSTIIDTSAADTTAAAIDINVTGNATLNGVVTLDTFAGQDDATVIITGTTTLTIANDFTMSVGAATTAAAAGDITMSANSTIVISGASKTVIANIEGNAIATTVSITGATTFNGDIGKTTGVTALTVAADTTLTYGSGSSGALAITATTVTLNSGSTLTTASSTSSTITGAVEGSGTLDVNEATTVVGTIGNTTALTAITVADAKVLTANSTVVKATNITLQGATAELNVTGAATITGDIDASTAGQGILDLDNNVTVVGGIGSTTGIASIEIAAANILSVSGNVNATATTIADSATSGITLNGASAQTWTGTINGTNGTDGDILITNTSTSGATFAGVIGTTQSVDSISVGATSSSTATFNAAVTANGAITVGAGTGGGVATFKAATGAGSIVLGDGAANAGANTVTFDGTTAGFTATGAISGAAVDSDVNTVNVIGGNTITFANAMGTGVDALNITSATLVNTGGGAIQATTITMSGTSATLQMAAAGTITGNVQGAGTLDIDAATTVLGSIGSTTALTAIDVADTITLTVDATNGNVTMASSSILVNDTAGTNAGLTFAPQANTITVSSTIKAGTASQGLITVQNTGNVTFNDIGESGTSFGLVTIGDATNNALVTASGNIFAANLTLDDASVMNVTGSSKTISAVIEAGANGAGSGTVDLVSGASTTFTGNIGATNRISKFEISSGATAKMGGISVDASDLSVDGTWEFTNTVTIGDANTIVDLNGATLKLNASSFTGVANTVLDGETANAVMDSAALTTVEMDTRIASGTTIILVNGGVNNALVAADFSVTDNGLFTYTTSKVGNDINVVVAKKSSSAAAATLGVTADAAVALDSANTAVAGDTVVAGLFSSAINAGGTTAKEAAEQVQGSPANLSSVGSAAVSATGSQVIAVGTSRLASLRSGAQFASSQGSGFAGGADANKFGVWMKPFVNFGDQDQRTGIAGYETDTYGIAMGGDVKVGDDRRTTLGLSISYADTDIDSKGAGRAKTGIDSYQATLYADYTTNKWYVEGLVGFARNEIDTTRNITFSSNTASADYGSNQFMINIGGGMPMEVAKNHFITPNASFQYTMVENETYTETGAGTLNLRVDQDEVHIALGIFGARYHTHTEMKSGTLTPEIRTALTYDFAGDEGQSTSTFNGGGAAFSVQGADVVQLGYTAGLGLSYAPLANQGLTISANYDWNQKTDFVGHSANFSLRYEF
jgi:outer membrane autotransporter protein